MKVLVTGSKGCVGSALSKKLANEGHEVIAVDNASRGLNKLDTNCIKSIKFDCLNGIMDVLNEVKNVDCVAHFAAGTGSLSRPVNELRELNVVMTQRIYEDAKKAGVKSFLYPTTSLSQGVPDSPYVFTKQEAMYWLLEQPNDINLIPLQFCNIVGAYQGATEYRKLEVHIIPTMVDCHLHGKSFLINGSDYSETMDGTPARDYVNICDVVDFMNHLIGRSVGGEHFSDIIYVGTGVTTTTKQLADKFNSLVGKLDYEIGPRRPFDTGSIVCPTDTLRQFKKGEVTLIDKSLVDEAFTLISYLR